MSTSVRWSRRASGLVLLITACWTAILILLYVNSWLLIGDLTRLGKLNGDYPFLPDFAGTLVLGIIGGLVGGYVLVYRINSGRRHHSFMSDIVRSGMLFVLVFVGVGAAVLFGLAFGATVMGGDLPHALQAGWTNIVVNLYTPSFLAGTVVWGLLASGTQFMLQVNDKFGPGILWKLITGRYYHPREETRIFMFLDLRSSTAIAESLGHERYFTLLRELYQDITRPIMECSGEIYQYVGDEVVVTWSIPDGVRDWNCLRCWFAIERTMADRRSDYLNRFGVAPAFKAGMHAGPAMVGEIGVVKKDIVFSGDVLNTAARITSECNRHGVELLTSQDLLGLAAMASEYETTPIGEISLRGKAEPLSLSNVRMAHGAL